MLSAGLRLLAAILLVLLLGSGAVIDHSLRGQVMPYVRDHLFDFVTWEVDALWFKVGQELLGVHPYLPPEVGRARLVDYLEAVARVQALEAQINAIYADPTIEDPAASSAAFTAERDALRRQLAADQPLVEGILEDQVSAVLADEGFGLLGQPLPPVSMHFTAIPTLLIVSPRDRIELAVTLELDALPVEQRQAIEDRIDAALGVSSLIAPLGGLSLYPSMIVETSSVAQAIEVTAHEWTHHYLMFAPLGLEYTLRPDTRVINETVATYFGREIARRVMAHAYPDLPPPNYPSYFEESTPAASPAPFDYYAVMHETRVRVDELLADGAVEEAEAYMEAQRRRFVAHGYALRKLNTAYFAFHGGYQGGPGAGGSDTIGPAVEELLRLSPDLHTWLTTLRGITTRAELEAAVEAARAAALPAVPGD